MPLTLKWNAPTNTTVPWQGKRQCPRERLTGDLYSADPAVLGSPWRRNACPGWGRDGLAAGPSAVRAAGVEMRNDFPGRSELLDDQEASRFLHQDALALVVHVARSDDKTDRDAANELVLADRERNKFRTGGVRAFTDKLDDSGVFAALRALFVDLSAQSLIQRGLPLALLLFPVCSQRSSTPACGWKQVRRVVATQSSRPHSRACADRRCYPKGYAPKGSGTSG